MIISVDDIIRLSFGFDCMGGGGGGGGGGGAGIQEV